LPIFYCSSRRPAALYPNAICQGNISEVHTAARTDYAANSGTTVTWASMFVSFATADGANFPWPDTSSSTGVSYGTSEVKMAQIRDGASCTYLLGEKSLNPDNYLGTTGAGDPTDDGPIFGGYDADYNRYGWRDSQGTNVGPSQDRAGYNDYYSFGSAHAGGLNMAMCDGSVRCINYTIDPDVHACLCNRHDGQTIDGNKF
jgi:prepilin-type processing-associated H-X9-DG protein